MLDWKLVTRCCWGINLAVGVTSPHRASAHPTQGVGLLASLDPGSTSLRRHPGSDELDFDERARDRQRDDLHRRARRQVRLRGRTEVPRISLHEPLEIHRAALGRVAD